MKSINDYTTRMDVTVAFVMIAWIISVILAARGWIALTFAIIAIASVVLNFLWDFWRGKWSRSK